MFHFCIAICYFCPGTSGTSCTSCNYIIYIIIIIIGSRSANPMNIKIHQDPPRSTKIHQTCQAVARELQGNHMSITAIIVICHPQPRPTTVFLPADASPVPADTSGTCDMCLKGQHMEASCSIIQHPTGCSHQHEVCAGLVQQARDCSVVLSPASTSWLFSTHDDVCNFSIFFPVHLCPLCF